MRATDERSSINAKCHSSLDLPDSSQGKQFNPHHGAAPLGQIRLRRVWKKALDSSTVISEEEFGEKSLASRADGCLDNTCILCWHRLPEAEGSGLQLTRDGGGGPGSRGMEGTLCSLLCPLADELLPCTLETSTADTSPVKVFCSLPFCTSAPLRPGSPMNTVQGGTC